MSQSVQWQPLEREHAAVPAEGPGECPGPAARGTALPRSGWPPLPPDATEPSSPPNGARACAGWQTSFIAASRMRATAKRLTSVSSKDALLPAPGSAAVAPPFLLEAY